MSAADTPMSSDSGEISESRHVAEIPSHESAEPAISAGPIVPRYVAATVDNAVAIILGYAAAKSVSDDLPAIQGILLVGAYLGYFLLFEVAFSRTPGKLLTGLIVVQFGDGRPCTLRQAAIRTGLRVLEVNPLLLGAIPAALLITFSPYRQRLGDRLACTMVVEARRSK